MTRLTLFVVCALFSSASCSSKAIIEEAVPISARAIGQSADCHKFVRHLVAPVLEDVEGNSSVEMLSDILERSNSELRQVLSSAAQRRSTSNGARNAFEAFNSVASRLDGYPSAGCGPLFHELVAETLYLAVTNGDESRAPKELAEVPGEKVMIRRLKLLELLISSAAAWPPR